MNAEALHGSKVGLTKFLPMLEAEAEASFEIVPEDELVTKSTRYYRFFHRVAAILWFTY